jgi:hypothetical protein
VRDDRVTVVEGKPEELAATARFEERASDEYGLEVRRAGDVTPYRSRVQDPDGKDRAAGDQPGEARPYGLDFG